MNFNLRVLIGFFAKFYQKTRHQIIGQNEYHYMLRRGFEGNINLLASILGFTGIPICWTLKILNLGESVANGPKGTLLL